MTKNLDLVLEHDGVELIAPYIDATHDVFEYGSDPEFCRYLTASPFNSVVDAELFIKKIIDDNECGKRMYWMIRVNGKVIGTIGFIYKSKSTGSTVEIGYGISRNYWGQGVFSRLLDLIVGIAIKLKKTKLVAISAEENIRNSKALEKYGFVHEISENNYRQYALLL